MRNPGQVGVYVIIKWGYLYPTGSDLLYNGYKPFKITLEWFLVASVYADAES